MALQKMPVSLNFGPGLDTKTDSYQVPIGKFLTLVNSVFTTGKRLTKRNGFPELTALPNADQTNLSTLNNNLIATGSNLYAFSADTNQWFNKGITQPIQLSAIPAIRNSNAQIGADIAIAANGLSAIVYMEGSNAYYSIQDSSTGEQIIAPVLISSDATAPRVALLGLYFVVTYILHVGGTYHIQYIAIPVNMPTSPRAPVDLATNVDSATAGYDTHTTNNNMYLSWSTSGAAVNTMYLTSGLVASSPVTITGHTAGFISVTSDLTTPTPIIWVSFWDSGSTNTYTAAYSNTLIPILATTLVSSSQTVDEITSSAQNGINTIFYEVFEESIISGPMFTFRHDLLNSRTVTMGGTVSAEVVVAYSTGLASKSFIDVSGKTYLWGLYGSPNQPTYFLLDSDGNVYARLAYSNGSGYLSTQVLSNVVSFNNAYYFAYLFKDFLTTINKTVNTNLPVNAIYTNTGINTGRFTINASIQYSSEIADTLHLTGGQLWDYDGVIPTENNFQYFPDNISGYVSDTSPGNITAQIYNYSFTYEWTDNTGKIIRSAPSIPLVITVSGAATSITLYVPTLHLTYKPNVRIVGYRWSVGQPVFYQFTSVSSPVINDPTADYATIVDTNADSAILGNAILYTTGGVVEDIAAPASTVQCLFKNRLFLVDAEDQNLLWYSKQVIEGVPVEMSDLFTLYVAPTTGSQGSTGPITALSAMDDKLIIFKKDAIYYLTGTGPDNTGANNDFTDPIFITASVGCANPDSIVLMKDGIMFQSDKGIWLLGRDLSTNYVGAPVEAFNSFTVTSALQIPGTNQVRFGMNNNQALMYDYFFQQWGTFDNIRSISAVLYDGLHTYLTPEGLILQETQGVYSDGSSPVLMSFTTAWASLAGLQGYERFYFGYLLGTYKTPFKLNLSLSYDYKSAKAQNILITPSQTPSTWGSEALWGDGPPWGSQVDAEVFAARFFPSIQKCESFQVTVQEVFDASFGLIPGEGLTLSGLNLIVGTKRGFRTQRASRSFGT